MSALPTSGQSIRTLPYAGSDALQSPTTLKTPRFQSSQPDQSSTTATKKARKIPKGHKQNVGAEKREFVGIEVSYLDTAFEVDDSAEYKDSLLSLEGIIAKSGHPNRQHMRQLLALCFFPLMFKPPTRLSAFRKSKASSNASTTKPDLQPFDVDPFTLSHKKMREEARKVLEDIIETNGTEVVCRAIRGYGMPRPPTSSTSANDDPFAASTFTSKSTASASTSRPTKKQRVARPVRDPLTDSEEDLAASDGDEALVKSAKRIGAVENLWDFLAGTAAQKQRIWKRDEPILKGGWEVLRSLVEGWESELARKGKVDSASPGPPPISLLRYFKPSATSTIARELSPKALDVAFWPFSEAALPISSSTSDGDSDEDDSDDDLFSDEEFEEIGKKDKGKEEGENDKFEGGMSLEEKKEVGVRLLLLIGECAVRGHLYGSATLAELVQRMKTLDLPTFTSFLEVLSLLPSTTSVFLPRLLVAYLETYSHSTSASASLDLPSLSGLNALNLARASGNSEIITSPRKRALAAQSSMVSTTSQDVPIPSSHTAAHPPTPQQIKAEFWRTPSLTSSNLLPIFAKIPIEVPLSASTDDKGKSTGRRPKSSSMDKSFVRAEKAAGCHDLVKAVLVDIKVNEYGSTSGEAEAHLRKMEAVERLRNVVLDVRGVVEDARERNESQ